MNVFLLILEKEESHVHDKEANGEPPNSPLTMPTLKPTSLYRRALFPDGTTSDIGPFARLTSPEHELEPRANNKTGCLSLLAHAKNSARHEVCTSATDGGIKIWSIRPITSHDAAATSSVQIKCVQRLHIQDSKVIQTNEISSQTFHRYYRKEQHRITLMRSIDRSLYSNRFICVVCLLNHDGLPHSCLYTFYPRVSFF